MSQTAKAFILSWLAFGACMAAVFTFQFGPQSGVPCGIVAGLLWAAIMSAFAKSQAQKLKVQSPLADGETLLKDGPANHFVRFEGVGGWLFLTPTRLCFRSHKVNIQNHELSFTVEEIVKSHKSLTLGFIPNGLTVESNKGKDRFVVNGAGSWVSAIEKAKSARA